MRKFVSAAILIVLFSTDPQTVSSEETFRKTSSVLYPRALSLNAIANAEKFEWARQARDRIVERAKPWVETSDDDLWAMMFGPAIPRSWMVWSDGYCPSCKKDVKMYSWKIDPWKFPFKTQCPHCDMLFPTNDFSAFYRSGLDRHAVFDPKLADRSLLFNSDHPDPADPLHRFGVDDGTGYVEGEKRWRFIGAYLIYGHWKILVLAGVNHLSEAYFVTGEPIYAHKAAILLDRIADVYPTFDFIEQAVVYERKLGSNGYVSTWHDACEEVRELAQSYDRIFDALPEDTELVKFLSRKAETFDLENKKRTFVEIQKNIEDRIFRDTIAHEYKIKSNYPRTPVSIVTMETVVGWPANRDRVMKLISDIIDTSTKVDGVTGEKGMTGYGTIGPRALGELIGVFDRLDPNLFRSLYSKFPVLHQTYRFHVDMWCMETFYPRVGDCGTYGQQVANFAGLTFRPYAAGSEPSMFQFLWRLYELTGDPTFVQCLFIANGKTVDDLPHDLCTADPEAFQKKIEKIVSEIGIEIKLPDVNKRQWKLAVLRSGKGQNRRAAWIDYDSGGKHSHKDGMNIGLFAKGLDLLPDFGYPPVGYGGWDFPKAVWYTKTAAHNTIVVDGQNQQGCEGKTILWGSGKTIHLIRASAPDMIPGNQEENRYERTLALVDLSPEDSYLLDVFNVKGGNDHAKFVTPFFGTPKTSGLNLKPAPDFGHDTLMHNTQTDSSPNENWSVDWTIDDYYKYRKDNPPVHLRYTGLTPNVETSLSECWVDVGSNFGGGEKWVSRLMVRRNDKNAPLSSSFASLLEPYTTSPKILRAKRFPLTLPDGTALDEMNGAIMLDIANGRTHTLAFSDRPEDQPVIQPKTDLTLTGTFGFISSHNELVEQLALAQGTYLKYGNVEIALKKPADFIEIEIEGKTARVLTGNASMIRRLSIDGKSVTPGK